MRSPSKSSIRVTISRSNKTITISRFTRSTPTRPKDSQWTKRTLGLSILHQLEPSSDESDSAANTLATKMAESDKEEEEAEEEDSSKTFQEADLDINVARTLSLDPEERDAVVHAQKCRQLLEMIEYSTEFADLGLKASYDPPIRYTPRLEDHVLVHEIDKPRPSNLKKESPAPSSPTTDPWPATVTGYMPPPIDCKPPSSKIAAVLQNKISPRPTRRSLSP